MRKKASLGSMLLLGAACVVYGANARVHAASPDAIVVFGDSFSDTGLAAVSLVLRPARRLTL